MTFNVAFAKLLKIKGIGYILLALVAGVGILLFGGKEQETNVAVVENSTAAYVSQEEGRLADLGKKLCGVNCKVAVYVSCGYTYSYAGDQSVKTTYNPDGTVAEKETVLETCTVSLGGGTTLVQIKEKPPHINGVAAVCSGASLGDVAAFKSLIMALYSLEEGAVFVTN